MAPNYFETLTIPLLRGRYFTPEDDASGSPVVVTSKAFADRLFKGSDPIGRQLMITDGGVSPREIVGVVGDVLSLTLVRAPMPQAYVPFEQLPQRAALRMRGRLDISALQRRSMGKPCAESG